APGALVACVGAAGRARTAKLYERKAALTELLPVGVEGTRFGHPQTEARQSHSPVTNPRLTRGRRTQCKQGRGSGRAKRCPCWSPPTEPRPHGVRADLAPAGSV